MKMLYFEHCGLFSKKHSDVNEHVLQDNAVPIIPVPDASTLVFLFNANGFSFSSNAESVFA